MSASSNGRRGRRRGGGGGKRWRRQHLDLRGGRGGVALARAGGLRALVDATGRAPERLDVLDLRTAVARGGGVEHMLAEAEAALRGWLPTADAARRAPARCSLVLRDRRGGYLAIGNAVVGGQDERACQVERACATLGSW